MPDIPQELEFNIIETSRLLKFGEGKDPEKDEPDEILEQSRTLSQEEVRAHIDAGRIEITPEGTPRWVPEKITKQE